MFSMSRGWIGGLPMVEGYLALGATVLPIGAEAGRDKLIELMQIREQITQAIEAVEDYDLQTILIRHYLAYETFETIAEKMHYEKRTIQRKHKAALEKMSLNVTLKV